MGFLDASLETRARRRYEQLAGAVPYEKVLTALGERDARDRQRHVAPLRPAEDAHYIDTDQRSVDEVLEATLSIVKQTLTSLFSA